MPIFKDFKEKLELNRKKKQQDEWFYYTLLKIRKESKKPSFDYTLRGSYGICYLIYKEFKNHMGERPYLSFEDVSNYVQLNCKDWDHFSGDARFPIPSHIKGLSPSDLFCSLEPRWSGEYGNLRRDLLDYLINKARYRVYKARREAKSL